MKEKRYKVFDFGTNTEKVYTDKDVKIYANHVKRSDVSPDLANKVAHIIEAMEAAAGMLETISFEDVDPNSRIAGLFAGQAQQLQQQTEILNTLIQ